MQLAPTGSPARHRRAVRYEGAYGSIELRGSTLRINGIDVRLAPAPLAVFGALLEARGAVLTRAHLAAILPGASDAHTLNMTVSRLRKALPDPRLVATVVKRGYRIPV